jgi:putative pre-16S rRNA nuclease
MSIAALDLGRRRIGIAIWEGGAMAPNPLATIERRSAAEDLAALGRHFRGRAVERVIVGLPLNMDGSEGAMAQMARSFGNRLSAELGLPVEFHDERLTSFEAEQRLGGLGIKRGRRKPAIDAVAATVILEEWIATHRGRDA